MDLAALLAPSLARLEASGQSGNAIDNDCTTINIAPYNIRDGHNSDLEAALGVCEKMRIAVFVLTETRLSTDRRHTATRYLQLKQHM
jgi:hypothetical protein